MKTNLEIFEEYQEKITQLIIKLNDYHQTNYSKKFWKIVIGKWLMRYLYFLNFYNDEYQRQQNDAKKFFENVSEDELFQNNLAKNMLFIRNHHNDPKFKKIFQKTVAFLSQEYFLKKDFLKEMPAAGEVKEKNECKKTQTHKKNAVSNIFLHLITQKNWAILSYWLKKNDVSIVPGELTNRWQEKISNETPFDFDLRKKLFAFPCKDRWDFLFWNSLVYHFPKIFLEDFSKLDKKVKDTFDMQPLNEIFVMDFEMAYWLLHDYFIAWQTEYCGAKLIDVQHGGVYGMYDAKFLIGQPYEFDVCDYFVSYGWQEIPFSYHAKKIIFMPNLCLLRNQQRPKKNKDTILYCTTTEEMGVRNDETIETPYRKNLCDFLNKILTINHANIEWRSYDTRLPNSIASQKKFVQNHVKFLNRLAIDVEGDFYQRLAHAKLYVVDHCSTTMLETIAIHQPTICFFNSKNIAFTNETRQLFEKMKRVKMLFDTGNEAVEFIQSIYPNVDEWWNQPDVKNVREEFIQKFSRTSGTILKDYLELFVNGIDNPHPKKIRWGNYCLSADYFWIIAKDFLKEIDRFGVLKKIFHAAKKILGKETL